MSSKKINCIKSSVNNRYPNKELKKINPCSSQRKVDVRSSPIKIRLKLPKFAKNKKIIKKLNKIFPNFPGYFSPQQKRENNIRISTKKMGDFSPSPCIHSGRNTFMNTQNFTSNFAHDSGNETDDNIFKLEIRNNPSSFVNDQFPQLFKPKIFNFSEENSRNLMNPNKKSISRFKNFLRTSFEKSLKISQVINHVSPKITEIDRLPREEFRVCFKSPQGKRSGIRREKYRSESKSHPFKNSFLSSKLNQLQKLNLEMQKKVSNIDKCGKDQNQYQFNRLFN
ncbi:unnamed protein product [Moneuplotes crassus]|uniref:Uncharacterized protein n=1 Tax=Euplotes crassus TaxID=5936 RepID=A0AAD2D0R0_EUPCR|nr:unnamed protein product [Moneuplotes crassus]